MASEPIGAEELRRLGSNPSLCFCLQEIMLGTSQLPLIFYYRSVLMPPCRDGGTSGGSAIYTQPDVSYSPFSLQTPFRLWQFSYTWTSGTLVSLYLPQQLPSKADICQLVRQLLRLFIVLGDMNGRYPTWGKTVTIYRGDKLFALFEELELEILNMGQFTHFHI